MPLFRIAVCFLDPTFHGRADAGEPEWPPSPLRLFQAVVAAAAARWPGETAHHAALRWLEALPPPVIVAPAGQAGTPHRLAVPNNDLDLLARDWARGAEPDKSAAKLKTMKPVQPTHLRGGDMVHYLWQRPDPLPAEEAGFAAVLAEAARSVVALGWGIDQTAARADLLTADEAAHLPGERWLAGPGAGGNALRVPTPGTLEALLSKHDAFLGRLAGGGVALVPPLTAFATAAYRRPDDVVPRPFAAFELLTPDAAGYRPFDPVSRAVVVAGMVRHAADEAARRAGWPAPRRAAYIHGHALDTAGGTAGPARGEGADCRLGFLPLPSITPRPPAGTRVESIRRVLVTAPPGDDSQAVVAWLRQALSGAELLPEGGADPAALLTLIPAGDPNVRHYTRPARVWSSVTPVVMPGHTNGPSRAQRILRRAFTDAGWPPELVAAAHLETRPGGFRAGVDLAGRYFRPEQLDGRPVAHVRVTWPVPVPGPLAVGAGRYRGLGVFAAEG